jgi:hypothetical protein
MIILLKASDVEVFTLAQEFFMKQDTSPPWSKPKQKAETYSDDEKTQFQASFEDGYKAGKKALKAFQKVCI